MLEAILIISTKRPTESTLESFNDFANQISMSSPKYSGRWKSHSCRNRNSLYVSLIHFLWVIC